MSTDDKFKEAMKFHYTLVGQSWIFGFLFAIILSETLPALEDLNVIPGILLVFLLSRVIQGFLKWSNHEQYEEYRKVIDEYIKENSPYDE